MTQNLKVALLPAGELLAKLLQWASALAGGVVVLLIPVVLLASQGMLPGASDSSAVQASPFTVVAIFALLALILAALFHFFGHLRALMVSASEGDPFTPANADRLISMAWLFVGVKILALLIGGLRFHLASLMDPNANGADYVYFSLYDLDAILIVIILFALAGIFRHGTAMRDDLEGTV